jgi:hypothetical protein
MRAACPAHFSLLDLITINNIWRWENVITFSLRECFQLPISSALLGQNVLSHHRSETPLVYVVFSLNVRDQILLPSKTTDKINLFLAYFPNFEKNEREDYESVYSPSQIFDKTKNEAYDITMLSVYRCQFFRFLYFPCHIRGKWAIY